MSGNGHLTLPFILAPQGYGGYIFRDKITNCDQKLELHDFSNDNEQLEYLTDLGVEILKVLLAVEGINSVKVFMQAVVISFDETKGAIADINSQTMEKLFNFFVDHENQQKEVV